MNKYKSLLILIVGYCLVGKALGINFQRLLATFIVKLCKTVDELHDIYSMLGEKEDYGNTADSSIDIDD